MNSNQVSSTKQSNFTHGFKIHESIACSFVLIELSPNSKYSFNDSVKHDKNLSFSFDSSNVLLFCWQSIISFVCNPLNSKS